LQGPVAVKHSKVVNEPVKEILDGIYEGIIKKMQELEYPTTDATHEDFGCKLIIDRYQVDVVEDENFVSLTPTKLIPGDEWLKLIAGSLTDKALQMSVVSSVILRGSNVVENQIRELLQPKIGNTVKLRKTENLNVISDARGFGLESLDNEIKLTLSQFGSELVLKYKYSSGAKFAPIHEVMNDRNSRINQFYYKIWFSENMARVPSITEKFTCSGLISEESVRKFCANVENYCPAFGKSVVPIDYAIVVGWKAVILPLFSSELDGDLLKLVHLSNSFKKLDDSNFEVGQTINTSAKIKSITISDAGKTVKVVGVQSRNGLPILEVSSEFLYRGHYTDFENCFVDSEIEPREVKMVSKKDVAILMEKPWFTWVNQSNPLQVGDNLIFRCNSKEKMSNSNKLSFANTYGNVYVTSPSQGEVVVATVTAQFEKVTANPVLGYLDRHSSLYLPMIPLSNEYHVATSEAFKTPKSNLDYSLLSGDTNPIHTNSNFSNYVGLPGTITHGMWTSAATRKVIDLIFAKDQPHLVQYYKVNFVGMVLPQDELKVNIYHVGMRDGSKIIRLETVNQRNEVVLNGTAEVLQEKTAFVFTGQGSQEQGMGMDLYQSSKVARAVWDKADSYLQETYCFSIIDIVKNNPETKTVYFGGFLGQRIRDRYMAMTYDTVDSEGKLKKLALFPDINLTSTSYSFSSPNGLLFSTQFAQIALVVTEKASFDHLKAMGLVGKSLSAFAGHSLGEYSALASITDFLNINSLCDIVFYRGLTMQRAVERDEKNRSNYAMCAVNPSRINSSFNEKYLTQIVDGVAKCVNGLCEIVNFNVENQQYVVAGELVALETLSNVLNYLKEKNVDFNSIHTLLSVEDLESMFTEIVTGCYEKAQEGQVDGFITLKRGYASIPLPGIDIPFHSKHIWSGVGPFRSFISRKIDKTNLNVDLLIGKYIPNLVAIPFSLEKKYIELVVKKTSSPGLKLILEKWGQESWESPAERQKLGYIILVELLAYQFASPVRWIETQDQFFDRMDIRRLLEVGPAPILTGMANRTLSLKYSTTDVANAKTRSIFCISKHIKEVYYEYEIVQAEVKKVEESPSVVVAAQIAPAAEPISKPSSKAEPISEENVQVKDIIQILIAQKLKKSPNEVSMTKSIKDLVGGKSTLQNEIVGDLQAEFPNVPERSEELPLEELCETIQVQHSGKLGKHTSSLISRVVSHKFPGGFALSAAQQHLAKRWGLGPLRVDSVLLRGLAGAPANRMATEQDAKTWLDEVTHSYAKEHNLSLDVSSGSSEQQSMGAMMNSEEFDRYKAQHEEFVSQHVELYMRYLGKSSRQGNNLFLSEKLQTQKLQEELDAIYQEHGQEYLTSIKPVFNTLKSRIFDSSWNWVRQDAFMMWYDMIFGRLTVVDRDITGKAISILNRSDPAILDYINYYVNSCIVERGENYVMAKELGAQLLINCEASLTLSPKCKDVAFQTAPHTVISENGSVVYSEINRPTVRKLESYVKEMAAGNKVAKKVNLKRVQQEVANMYQMVSQQPQMSNASKEAIQSLYDEVMKSLTVEEEVIECSPTSLKRRFSASSINVPVDEPVVLSDQNLPYLHIKRNLSEGWAYSKQLTSVYLDILTEIATSGSTYENTNALLTGCGKNSIGVEVLKGLISGGCTVIVTTSSYSRATVEYYQGIYQIYGAKGSKLIVVPFNQASKQDVGSLIDYIYSTEGLALDLDYVVPFAAISENGREIDGIDDKSELAHRMMLTNLIRLIGSIKKKKEVLGITTRPTQVVLPQSPNHGIFGGDGLYAESKVGLETLFTKWRSESWSEYLSLVGAVIGWTRGTGLMNATNIVAEGIEKHGVRTFSAKEMAFNILGLMHPTLAGITSVEPLWAGIYIFKRRFVRRDDALTRIE
jgi:3-oxoacyl-ACP reductase-like protein/malonyl CoA-acyl carrier protein transacylase/acyl dehydratase